MRRNKICGINWSTFTIIFLCFYLVGFGFSNLVLASSPAQQLEQLLGDPRTYITSIEGRVFPVIGQILTAITSMLGLKFMLRAMFK